QHQLGVRHDGAGDLHALALAVGQGAEGAGGELGEVPRIHHLGGALEVERLVALPPAAGDGVGRGEHDVADPLVGGDAAGQPGGGEADAGAQLEDIDLAHALQIGRASCREGEYV